MGFGDLRVSTEVDFTSTRITATTTTTTTITTTKLVLMTNVIYHICRIIIKVLRVEYEM